MKYINLFLAVFVLSISNAYANSLLDSYYAYIGKDDLYNSQGSRLTEVWQIVRQDRANFHQFGIRQNGDEDDIFFASKQNRANAERMLKNGYISKVEARKIVKGNVLIHVEIYGKGNSGNYISVNIVE